ncbi:hypothetical protein COW36_12360 [bacterium (Candidatus Blackallbacteria) CG17_big_fil_post_rev_8_21_14_2_50_48_46]|uniref:Flagellar hook-length control protein-like C-terminal domain-containing protein n=1 Tax=bacterium (Candidatus Blackallbacteria) CG17_big_fil_post_rev_8_21_14_2_50_48_46 TaxID=2014261 RepID=A0A2M7G3X2_9BACT|nr:MAG: hypothetical protein COW64_02900 [bacterium (Candidatus Blackallbacteria) CG18_big_fil_WC_8_21_14_2_50_49_26]PIW16553.1 MAG: hypothetical protein COW36_12360 [bacterium (Candidatus Blackallbacteria) CG17_big_fil_post_rev_8_21_14_2_50_48_46]PIW46061.1 MAG: hypothetical protein COW20_17625 [bacterium (Candidatus Blackallbacteria) CG13_big_fil_rev_8_21_14_2_50_49_14]
MQCVSALTPVCPATIQTENQNLTQAAVSSEDSGGSFRSVFQGVRAELSDTVEDNAANGAEECAPSVPVAEEEPGAEEENAVALSDTGWLQPSIQSLLLQSAVHVEDEPDPIQSEIEQNSSSLPVQKTEMKDPSAMTVDPTVKGPDEAGQNPKSASAETQNQSLAVTTEETESVVPQQQEPQQSNRKSDSEKNAESLTAQPEISMVLQNPKSENTTVAKPFEEPVLEKETAKAEPKETQEGPEEAPVSQQNIGHAPTLIIPELKSDLQAVLGADASSIKTQTLPATLFSSASTQLQPILTAELPVSKAELASASESTASSERLAPIASASVFGLGQSGSLKSEADLSASGPPQHLEPHSPLPEKTGLQMMGEKIRLLRQEGGNEIRLSLKPAELGKISLQMVQQNQELKLHIFTDTVLAREVLESHLPLLKQNLQHQGLSLLNVEIEFNPQEAQGGFSEQRQSSWASQQGAQQHRTFFSEAEEDESLDLSQHLSPLVIKQIETTRVNFLA